MLAPEVETRPWDEQLALDDASYREQLAYLLERSAFYREKLGGGRVRVGGRCGRPRRDRAAAADREARAAGHARRPRTRSARTSARRRRRSSASTRRAARPARRATSRSPPATSTTGSRARRAATPPRASRAGQRIVSTYNAGPFVAGAALAAFDRIGLCHIPVGTGNTERLMRAIELLRPEAAVLTPSYAAYLLEWARARLRPRRVERRARARRGRAGRRRAGVPREARGRLGRARHRGDGDRRHRRLALGRVRGAGRHAPRRARLRPRRADRPRDGRGGRARGRRRRASSCSRTCSHRAAPLLRFRTRDHVEVRTSPCALRPHRPARALHRAHRRHADRARCQRLPLGDARGRERFRARGERPHPRPAAGARREAGAAAPRQRRARARARRPTPRWPRRSATGCATCSSCRRGSSSSRSEACSAANTSPSSSSTGGETADAEAPEPGRAPHHARRRRPADVDRLLGGRARDAVRLRAAEPRQRGREPPLLRPGRRPPDHRLHERGAHADPTRTPTDPGCVHHLAFSLSQATFDQAVERLDERGDPAQRRQGPRLHGLDLLRGPARPR